MKSASETLSPTRVKLTIEVPFEELKPSLDKAYKQIAQQISIPGFRKGKVPPPIIDQRVGRDTVLTEAVNDALPGLYSQALQEADVQPLGQPELEMTNLEYGQSLEFTAELDVRPDIDLPDYEGLEVSVDDLTVDEDDVTAQLDALRERFATQSDVERAAAEGDVVTIDLSASQDGEKIAEAQAEGLSYTIGTNTMLDGLDEALVGMSAGDEKVFTTTLVGGELKGAEVEVAVTLHAVKEQELPELDDDFAQEASEFDTVDELTADVRERVLRGKRMEQASAARDAVLEKLIGMLDTPVPEKALADEVEGRRGQIMQQLQYAGMTMDDFLESEEQTSEEFEADLEKRTKDSLVAQFILDDIAAEQEFGVEQDELTQHVLMRAQQSGQDPQQFAQHMMEHNHVPELISEIVRGKALAHLVESATVTDESGNPVDLKNLRGDGSLAQPGDDDLIDDGDDTVDDEGPTDEVDEAARI